MSTQSQLEELLTALATLTEHNSALQEQLIEQSKATKSEITGHSEAIQQALKAQIEANTEQQKNMAEVIAALTAKLKQYAANEHQIIDNANNTIAKNITKAFQDNERHYHALINKGFSSHIEQSAEQLLVTQHNISKQLAQLEQDAHRTAAEFNRRQQALGSYEQSYLAHSEALEQKVGQTLTEVTETAQSALQELADDFASKVSARMMLIMVGFFCLVLITFGVVFYFTVPSRAEIAERKEQYAALNKALLIDNIVMTKDGYYGRVTNQCYKTTEGFLGREVTYCKFD